ncbi:MAG: VWA domain-containing protein, partial [Candidatus Solibacter sp.]|nr:VWA domain-containing protein [Candidatus Solibacter sp.]
CLTAPNGIPRKVIVKSQEAYAFESYEFAGKRIPLKFFRKYFVFKEQPGKGYLIGDATVRDSTVGWVRKEDVIAWNHEQALFFINKRANSRAPVKLWTERREVGRPDAPYFEEDLSARETTEPFPILQKDGSAVRVAFLWGKQGSLTAVPVGGLDVRNAETMPGESVQRGSAGGAMRGGGVDAMTRAQKGLRRLDIAIVIDVTSSMGPYMDAVKQRMTRIVDQLANLGAAGFQVESNIAVVAYRDYADAKTTFTTKHLDFTKDRSNVYQFMSELRPYSVGKDKYEAVFEGLSDAIERLSWGAYSHKVMFLVGDAPPQGFTPTALPEEGVQSDSPYFSGTFLENARTIQRKVEDSGIRFYALGVGNDPEMEDSFRRIVGQSRGGFRALAGATEFIAQLEVELRAQMKEHSTTGPVVAGAIEKFKAGGGTAALSGAELEALTARNISPEKLEELKSNRIQTGWFDVDTAADRVSICVYLRKRDLEETLMGLRSRMKEGVSAQELDVLKSILEPHVGKESLRNVQSINDLIKLVADLPLPPEVVRQIVGKHDDSEVTRILRTKMNNILILLLQKELFNNYEEGWIPLEYLPGSMYKER